MCKYRISSVSLAVRNFYLHVLQASSLLANPQNDVVQHSVPYAKGKPFHKSRLLALTALVWLPNRRSPNHTTSIGAISHRPKQFRGIAHWLSWQSHWGNGIKDLLFEESTSPCGTSHPLNQCPFQSSKPKAWNTPQRNPKPDLEMHPTDYWCGWIQEHCQAHHMTENEPAPTCLNHTIHKQSQSVVDWQTTPVALKTLQLLLTDGWGWLKKILITCHKSHCIFFLDSFHQLEGKVGSSVAWQSLMVAVHPRSPTRWMGYLKHQQPWGQPPRPWHQPGECQISQPKISFEYMDVSKNMDGENKWKTLLKWMIWGYPYFWKHPYSEVYW